MEGKKPQQIRIATIDAKGIQGCVLKGLKATLKVLHVTNNVQLLVSVLEKPEDPSPSQGIRLVVSIERRGRVCEACPILGVGL